MLAPWQTERWPGERRRLERRQSITVHGTTSLAAALITIGTLPQARGTLDKIAYQQQRPMMRLLQRCGRCTIPMMQLLQRCGGCTIANLE